MKKRLIFCCVLCLLLTICAAKGESASPALRPFMKETYPMEDTYSTGVDPNVLFLLDTGSPMTMSPKGRMPLVDTMWNPIERAELLAECTYGTGTRPFTTSGSEPTGNLFTGISPNRYGRDLYSSNNIIGDPDSYYSPYEDKPYFLTFKNPTYANLPKNAPSSSFPAAAQPGMTVAVGDANINNNASWGGLVPNDSRMYQMKLVLWRLLSDENKQLLSRMKIAMATSYQEINYPTRYLADFYKNPPYAVNTTFNNVVSGDPYLHGSTYEAPTYGAEEYVNGINFPYGTGPGWATGILGSNGYGDASSAYAGVLRDYYDLPKTSSEWIQVNRAVLKLPFDYLYKVRSNGEYYPTQNLETFRKYINGIEAGDGTNITDPELVADGRTPLSTSIFGRDDFLSGGTTKNAGTGSELYPAIYFETRPGKQKQYYGASHIPFEDFLISDDISKENLRAGLAVGSVIDFFSPRTENLNFVDGGTGDTRGYFPVIGSCQSNWLVVFTAGNDSDPSTLTAQQAVRKLYATSKNDGIVGRDWNKATKKWVRKIFDMDSGIRTLVVGFVDPTATDESSVKLRETLTEMAAYGAPYTDGSPNYNSQPYFANDVPSLIASLKAVLMRINSDKFAASAPTILPQAAGVTTAAALYAPSYKIEAFDQWEGWFVKYKLITENNPVKQWEMNERFLARGGARDIFTTTASYDVAPASTAVDRLENIDFTLMAGIPSSHVSDFEQWLQRYNGQSLLGDMEHSGFDVVGDSVEVGSRDAAIYLQTNRGVLHAVDDATGDESWAFIPPNIFQTRIKSLKFDGDSWIEGDGVSYLNSRSMSLLDGGVVAKDVRDNSGNYHTVLIANMGWGGNSFYAMDVTAPTVTPKFLWAVDNARYDTNAVPLTDGVKRWGSVATLPIADANYSDLGLTIVSPAIISVDQKTSGTPGDVGVLPAGLGYKLGADSQGKALYVFDLDTGESLRTITGSASDFEDPTPLHTRSLGMMVAPVTYVPDATKTTTKFFTADSQGNVLFGDTQSPVEDWKLKSIFQLLSTGGEPICIPKALAYGRASSTKDEWVFGGTADLMVPDTSVVRKIENPEQYIWAQDITKASGDVTTADLFSLAYVKDAIETTYGVNSDDFVPANYSSPDFKGWALKLRPATPTTAPEYVTTSPYLYYGVLYVTTFVPKPIPEDMASRDLCPELGDSKFYALNPLSGVGRWPGGQQALVLKDIKISGMSAFGGSLYVGLKPFKKDALEKLPSELAARRVGDDGNMIRLDAIDRPKKETLTISPDIPYIQYWEEIF